MPLFPPRAGLIAALGLATVAASACAPLRTHQGYVIDADLVNSVRPGVDNKESVRSVLGDPTLSGTFDDKDWYYVSRDSRNYAFADPHAVDQTALHVRFDDAGNVVAVDKTGKEMIASIEPSHKITPTLGRKNSLFDDLFGNIGTVGAPGMGGGGGNGP